MSRERLISNFDEVSMIIWGLACVMGDEKTSGKIEPMGFNPYRRMWNGVKHDRRPDMGVKPEEGFELLKKTFCN